MLANFATTTGSRAKRPTPLRPKTKRIEMHAAKAKVDANPSHTHFQICFDAKLPHGQARGGHSRHHLELRQLWRLRPNIKRFELLHQLLRML
jgi:hypothetical protein